MQPETQVKAEEKILQPQNIAQPISEVNKVEENAPEIKSEENKNNWKAFREQRESERKAKEASDKMALEERARAEALKAALEAVTNKPQQQRYERDEVQEESEDERIQKKIDAALAKERVKFQQEQALREQQEFPQRIAQSFPDFNQICNTENLDYLEYHFPEIAVPFKHMPDGFEKWSSLYKAVKRFVPNTDSRKDQAKADKNMQKPGSLSAPSVAQGGNAMPGARLDEAKKAENWQRMQKVLKGLS